MRKIDVLSVNMYSLVECRAVKEAEGVVETHRSQRDFPEELYPLGRNKVGAFLTRHFSETRRSVLMHSSTVTGNPQGLKTNGV